MENIIQLSEYIREQRLDEDFESKFGSEFEGINIKDFIVYNLSSYSEVYTTRLLIAIRNYWMVLTSSDWLEVLKPLEKKTEGFALLVSFFCKYLNVDLLNFYNQNEDVLKQTMIYIKNNPSLFSYSAHDDKQLENFKINKDYFNEYSKILVESGIESRRPKQVEFKSIENFKFDEDKGGYFPG